MKKSALPFPPSPPIPYLLFIIQSKGVQYTKNTIQKVERRLDNETACFQTLSVTFSVTFRHFHGHFQTHFRSLSVTFSFALRHFLRSHFQSFYRSFPSTLPLVFSFRKVLSYFKLLSVTSFKHSNLLTSFKINFSNGESHFQPLSDTFSGQSSTTFQYHFQPLSVTSPVTRKLEFPCRLGCRGGGGGSTSS